MRKSCVVSFRREPRDTVAWEEALGGVGGAAGRKIEGTVAIVDCSKDHDILDSIVYLCQFQSGTVLITHDDGDIEHHIRHITGLRGPDGVDQLADCCTKRIRKRR